MNLVWVLPVANVTCHSVLSNRSFLRGVAIGSRRSASNTVLTSASCCLRLGLGTYRSRCLEPEQKSIFREFNLAQREWQPSSRTCFGAAIAGLLELRGFFSVVWE